MLTSVACSCIRSGRKVSVPVAKLSLLSTVRNTHRTLIPGVQDLSRHRSSRLLTPTSWQLQRGLTARSVSLSASSNAGTDPLGSLSVPAESDPPDQDNFGSLSTDMSSKRSFRKSSSDIQDLRHRDGDDEEEDPVQSRRRPGRRNTPYWYFLQCKKLIKEGKVGPFEPFYLSSCVSNLLLFLNLIGPLTAAGGFGYIQQRHAAGGEAAAGGVQLHGPDRRLWSSWTTQEGLQTLQ